MKRHAIPESGTWISFPPVPTNILKLDAISLTLLPPCFPAQTVVTVSYGYRHRSRRGF